MAARISASVLPPSAFRLVRNILRRCPKAAAVTRTYLDHDNLVGTVFPELVSSRAVKLERRAGELGVEVEHQIEAVAAARGRVKGLTNKLERELAEETRAQDAVQLENAIDQFVRSQLASLK